MWGKDVRGGPRASAQLVVSPATWGNPGAGGKAAAASYEQHSLLSRLFNTSSRRAEDSRLHTSSADSEPVTPGCTLASATSPPGYFIIHIGSRNRRPGERNACTRRTASELVTRSLRTILARTPAARCRIWTRGESLYDHLRASRRRWKSEKTCFSTPSLQDCVMAV